LNRSSRTPDITLVTIVMMPKGVTRPGTRRFSRVEEYAYFCFFGSAGLAPWEDDLLTLGADELEKEAAASDASARRRPRWKGLLRSGTNSRRRDRQWLFYPVLIDKERGAILGAGEPLLPTENNGKVEWPEPDFDTKVEGLTPVWPVRNDGSLGNWGVSAPTLRTMIAKGYVKLGGYDAKRNTWGITYLSKAPQEQIAAGILEVASFDEERNAVDVVYAEADSPARRVKRVWHRTPHDAGTGGTDLLRSLLGGRAFPFAKSLYAVYDTLGIVLADKPDAVVVDAFAGSGTTMHATMLLNAQDGGSRQCVLITNNEVDSERARELKAQGHFPGDREYEREGIFEAVTRPRITAALTGAQNGRKRLVGSYRNGRPYADGFEENVEFFRLDYLDADLVDLGLEFEAIHPLLWLAAGGKGQRPNVKRGAKFLVAPECGYSVLFDDSAFREFEDELSTHIGVRHVFLITDSDEAYAEMRERLGPGRQTMLLYRDFLRHFRRRARS
jgi:adenine-specific DNA-methyltransferase